MNLVVYTNILTPYRKYFFDLLHQYCTNSGNEFHVIVMAETEKNRSWIYEDFKDKYTILLHGSTISYGNIYVHLNMGLKRQLKKLSPDIVVCAGSYLCPGVWNVTRWKRKLGYRCIYWSESHLNEKRNYSKLKLSIREAIRSLFYKRYDGFWYSGELSKQFVQKYTNKRDINYFFVPNLVEEEKYRQASIISQKEKKCLREKYQIELDQTVFICPARLSPAKGLLEFIDIYSLCFNKKNGTILVAGDGELKEKIKSKAKENKIDLRLLGSQSQERMVQLYSMADVFLLPSISDPNPLSCIEALWSGLPLLISNHCGNYPEVVKQGCNGYVFSYEDLGNTILTIENLISLPVQRKMELGRCSLVKAETQYNSQKVVNSLLHKIEDWYDNDKSIYNKNRKINV